MANESAELFKFFRLCQLCADRFSDYVLIITRIYFSTLTKTLIEKFCCPVLLNTPLQMKVSMKLCE